MNKFKLLTLSALLFLPAIATQAETNQYNIEIIIFEDSSNRYINSEQWPIIHHPENISETPIDSIGKENSSITETAIEFDNNKIDHPETSDIISITNNTSNALVEYVSKLKRSSRHNVLLHQSWQQTGLDDENAIDIRIDSRKSKNNIKDTMPLSLHSNLNQHSNTVLEPNVQGTMKLILGRYLHIHTDLIYKRQNKAYDPASPALHNNRFDEFEIKSQRRMRSKELHYLDHPLLGILVLVTPVDEQQTNTEGSE